MSDSFEIALLNGDPEIINEFSDAENSFSEYYSDNEDEYQSSEEWGNDQSDDFNDLDVEENEEEKYQENEVQYVTGDERISFPFLTIFEKIMLVGTRTKQLSNGAISTIDVSVLDEITPLKIAEEELRQKRIPFKIERPMPNNKIEIWSLDELVLLD